MKAFLFCIVALVMSVASFAYAQVVGQPDVDFITQLLTFIKDYGGLSEMLKIGGYILLFIALIKTSIVAPMWAKLPELVKTLVAPLLGLGAALFTQGGDITWASALAFMASGAGAVFVHEFLDGLKTIPGLGSVYVTIIDLLSKLFFKPAA